MHSKLPRRRHDEGFRSAGEDESEIRGLPRSKEILRRLSYKGCKEENNNVAAMPSVIFAFFFCTVYCSGNRLKIDITPYGKSYIIQLTELKFNIWRITFLKMFFNH